MSMILKFSKKLKMVEDFSRSLLYLLEVVTSDLSHIDVSIFLKKYLGVSTIRMLKYI